MTLSTWNINSIRVRLPLVLQFIQERQPHILLLQEIKCTNDQFPKSEFEDQGYNVEVHGEKSYNGVAILSKFPIEKVDTTFSGNTLEDQARFLSIEAKLPIGYSNIISLYAPNGGQVNSKKYDEKLNFFQSLKEYISATLRYDLSLIIGGDFNIAAENLDVYDHVQCSNNICFTIQERQKLRALINAGLCDLYRIKNPDKQEWSWWDYKGRFFDMDHGMRIDTIMSSYNVAQSLNDCVIEKAWRRKKSTSDHAPVTAIFSDEKS
ncbi:exodeoxyribonuclease III [Candidatus Sneabacter namystus]|uniref:Exodeoxyribonuclease III n=1 Tax=Candidatus Sneabacter namystus TaxID=2601646 RepID=A0A5C0UJ50_9RICK|nr:exodeoxyribonuclease III [Candidatus Sneabacter namystus]QEK39641.1 exodeoxyribonuclease III [Candidatus Sneabacter namystus]